MKNPRTIILDAVIGTILLFAAYVILNTINPALVTLQGTPRPSPTATAPAGGSTGLPTASPTSTPTPTPTVLPACTDLQIVYDQAKEACAGGDNDACTARDEAIFDAQDTCTLTF
jgi:hypothetical protein